MLLIMDANVLIDYANSDISILSLVSKHVGQVYIPSVILDEVSELSEEDCIELGFVIIDEEVELLLAAAEIRGALSFEDHVCLLLATEKECTCVSNDKPLRRACGEENISVMWGLRLMIELVDSGHLGKSVAVDVAEEIQKQNPRHITQIIVDEFKRIIDLI